MATATATQNKIATCLVTFSHDWIQLESTKTGNKLRLNLGRDPQTTWNALSSTDRALLAKLTKDPQADSEMSLTYAEMAQFKTICEAYKPQPIASTVQKVHDKIARRTHGANGADATEQRVNGLKAVVEATRQEYVALDYDIPVLLTNECPNPSHILWNHGFRQTESVWIMPKSQLDHPTIKQVFQAWVDCGIEFNVLEFSESQAGKIRTLAQKRLDAEINQIHTSLITCISNADIALNAAIAALSPENDTERTRNRLDSIRDGKIRASIKKSSEALDAAISCAEAYDLTEDLASLFSGLRSAIASQRESFNAYADNKGVKTV